MKCIGEGELATKPAWQALNECSLQPYSPDSHRSQTDKRAEARVSFVSFTGTVGGSVSPSVLSACCFACFSFSMISWRLLADLCLSCQKTRVSESRESRVSGGVGCVGFRLRLRCGLPGSVLSRTMNPGGTQIVVNLVFLLLPAPRFVCSSPKSFPPLAT